MIPQHEADRIRREAEAQAEKFYGHKIQNETFYQRGYKDGATAEYLRHKPLVDAQEEYIKLLGDELAEVSGWPYLHGWRSTLVEKGKELRERIEALNQLNQQP